MTFVCHPCESCPVHLCLELLSLMPPQVKLTQLQVNPNPHIGEEGPLLCDTVFLGWHQQVSGRQVTSLLMREGKF